MINLRQKELAKWQSRNFGNSDSKDMALGMAEEVGELCHFILKRSQKIREGAEDSNFRNEIADAWADTVIFGIQLLNLEGMDAEEYLTKVTSLRSMVDIAKKLLNK